MHMIEYIISRDEEKRGKVKENDGNVGVSTAVRLDKSKLFASRECVISLCDYAIDVWEI